MRNPFKRKPTVRLPNQSPVGLCETIIDGARVDFQILCYPDKPVTADNPVWTGTWIKGEAE